MNANLKGSEALFGPEMYVGQKKGAEAEPTEVWERPKMGVEEQWTVAEVELMVASER